jgi:hypothetical protein
MALHFEVCGNQGSSKLAGKLNFASTKALKLIQQCQSIEIDRSFTTLFDFRAVIFIFDCNLKVLFITSLWFYFG